MARSRNTITILAAAFTMAACVDQPTELPTTGGPSFDRSTAPGQQKARGLDAEYAGIAENAKGFGGMFYDENGVLNVYVSEDGDGTATVLSEVKKNLSKRGRTAPSDGEIRVLKGMRDYRELVEMRSQMGNVLGVPGVVFTDIDETRNSLTVGVLSDASISEVRAALAQAGVPADAVHLEVTEPVVPVADLRDPQDPMGGGLQIWRFIPPSTASICTLGFNVRRIDGNGPRYFFTNSHCTAVRGALDGTQWRQGVLSLATRTVATEVEEPPFFNCQYTGYRCRYSDAALGQYHDETETKLNKIWQTTAFGTTAPATLTTLESGHAFRIVGESDFPTVGDVVNKVGRTTGWTQGAVVATCIDTGVSGSNPPIAMLCQDRVNAHVAGGDSGSPVFQITGEKNDVVLHGILWGGSGTTYVFSAMANIRAEFAPFRTH